MQFSLAALCLVGMTSLSTAAPTAEHRLNARQDIAVGTCLSASSTLQTLIPDVLTGTTGGLVGAVRAILAGAPNVVAIHVFPAGCVGDAVDYTVSTVGDVVTVLTNAVNAAAGASFTISV